MSQAFVKESDAEWLGDIPPTMAALINFLTRENNGVKVYEKSNYPHPDSKKPVHEMSNGSHYSLDMDSRWYIYA